MRVIRTRRPPSFPPLRWYEDHVDSVPAAMFCLLRGGFDVAHAFHPAYAWGAAKAQALGAPPLVFSFHGIPERGYLVQRRYRLEMMKTAISSASRVTVLSEAAAATFRRYLLVDPDVLPGGVVGADFAVEAKRAEQPTLVCAASLGDPRKRAELLLAAFVELRRSRPEAALRIVRTRDPFMSPLELSLPDGAEWVEGDSTHALALAYASAHASVLPSVGEAFGLVALESLAAGTPVIAGRDSAPAELLSEGRTGELFDEADEASLVEAMERGLALGQEDGAAAACRAAAEPYDWERLVGSHETMYEAVLDGGRVG